MLVIYKGKLPAITTEYNGKKYCFSKENPIQEVPVVVYDFLKASRHVNAGDVQPYDEGYKLTIARLESEITSLKSLLETRAHKAGTKAVKDDAKKK